MPTLPQPAYESTPEWQSYLDLSNDMKPWLQIDATNTTYDTQLQDVIDAACEWVQSYLGRPVAPTTFFRRFSGNTGYSGAYIELPYAPVLRILSVVEYRGTSGPFTLVEQTPASQGTQDCFQCDYQGGLLIRTFAGLVQRPWFPGARNIEVQWQAGFNPIPRQIVIATKELAAWWWRNTQEATRNSPLRANGYEEPGTGSLWPAIPNRVTSMLEPFTQIGLG